MGRHGAYSQRVLSEEFDHPEVRAREPLETTWTLKLCVFKNQISHDSGYKES